MRRVFSLLFCWTSSLRLLLARGEVVGAEVVDNCSMSIIISLCQFPGGCARAATREGTFGSVVLHCIWTLSSTLDI